jgi:hypothetical protein
MMGGLGMLPPWAWIAIVAILMTGFRRGRRLRHFTDQTPRVIEREDPRVDDLQARVAELENRLDFTERLLAGRGQSAMGGASAERSLS